MELGKGDSERGGESVFDLRTTSHWRRRRTAHVGISRLALFLW